MLKKIILGLFLLFLNNFSLGQNFWERIQSPTDNFLRTLHFSDSLTGWVGGDSGSIFFTSDGGLNWTQQQTNTTSRIMRLFFLDDYRAWALAWADAGASDNSFYGTEILKTTDGGENWSVEQYREENVFLRGIYFLDSLKGFAGGEPGKFLQTKDGGINWDPVTIDSGMFSQFPVINLKFYNQFYGFACGGRIDWQGVIWRTTNGGENWQSQGVGPEPIYAIHFFDSLNVIGVGGDYEYGASVIRSYSAGQSWNYEELGIFGASTALSFRTKTEAWVPLSFSHTIMSSFNSGITWTDTAAVDSSSMYDLVFCDSLTAYAVGEEGVILKYKYQVTSLVNNDEEKPLKDFSLNQNFPNPFNPSTTINYNLLEPGQVSLNVYNVLGTHIETLLQEYTSSGNHSVVWNAEDEPSGVYYYQLNVNGKLETRKMLLLK